MLFPASHVHATAVHEYENQRPRAHHHRAVRVAWVGYGHAHTYAHTAVHGALK